MSGNYRLEYRYGNEEWELDDVFSTEEKAMKRYQENKLFEAEGYHKKFQYRLVYESIKELT